MKRTVLLASAAVVAAVPAVLGVAGNATFSQSIPAVVPAGASVLPAPARTDDSATTRPAVSPTHSPTVDDHGRRGATGGGHGADDATSHRSTSTTADDQGRRGATGGGHGADDATSTRTSTSTHTSTSTRSTASTDDHGSGVEPGDDSGGHGGTSGKGGSGSGKG